METAYKDYQFWSFIIMVLNFCGIIIVACFNWFSHHKIVGNDLLHLSADVKQIVTKQEGLEKSVGDLATDMAFIKGRCELHSSKVFKRTKKISNKV
jgi:hypothetical protein